jgi:lipoprotein-releasing system permease protein
MIGLAWRHLVSRKRQTFLTLMGIVLGAGAYVIISGFMLGFREFFVDQLINNDAHIKISAKDTLLTEHALDDVFFPGVGMVKWRVGPSGRKNNPKINNAQGWYDRLAADPRVTAFSPQLTTQVIVSKAGASATLQLVGVKPKLQMKVTNIARNMQMGKFESIGEGTNRLIMGDILINKLGAKLNQTVLVSNGRQAPTPFKIVGVFHSGVTVLDENTVFGSLSDAQKMNQTQGQISEISIKLKDVDQARDLAGLWQQTTSEKVRSWDQLNKSLLDVFRIQDRVRNMMTISILVVAGFGIYNILNMVVSQKRKEIAILRAIGYESTDILKLFLIQGLILGVSGGLIGMAFGFWLCLQLSKIPFSGGPMGSGNGLMMVSFNPHIYVNAFCLAFFSSMVASFLPARSASKLTPIEVIRDES